MLDTVVFDVDGTLVDSSYQHVLAWSRAFRAVGVTVPCCALHRRMGMGGDQLVAAVAGNAVEAAVGDHVREVWKREYDALLVEVRALPDAVEVLRAFRRAGPEVVLATSGEEDHIDRTLQILELGRDEFPLVSSADVDRTKPDGELVELAMESVGGTNGLLVGDTVWDVEAGERAGVPVHGVLTGGIAADVLRDAGALRVFDDVASLRASVDDVLGGFRQTREPTRTLAAGHPRAPAPHAGEVRG